MANVAVSTLIQWVRQDMQDWRDQDSITVSLSAGGTTLTVADTTKYTSNMPLEIEQENLIVRSITNATTMVVLRGAFGSAASTHVTGSDILLRPAFTSVQILNALNAALEASYPWIYQEVMDTSITVAASTYEYAVPYMPGTYGGDQIFIPRIFAIDILDPNSPTTLPWVPMSGWTLRRDITAPKIKIGYLENPGATLRVRGYGPFPDLTFTGNLHAAFPRNMTMGLREYAMATLTMSGEAGRLRTDSGLLDTREAAQRPGSSMAAANAFEGRFQRRLANAGMPPIRGRLTIMQ